MADPRRQRILMVMPRFPDPESGACEQDRAEGIRQLKRLGYDVKVIAKSFTWQDTLSIRDRWAAEGVEVTLVPYRYSSGERRVRDIVAKYRPVLFRPSSWDGAALEYTDPALVGPFTKLLDEWRPTVVWFEYTYLWPLFAAVRARSMKIAVRSINFEARHFLDEDGRTPLNYIKAFPKYISEYRTARGADVMFAITPEERAVYQKIRGRSVEVLPLRSIPLKLGTHTPRETDTLHVFFSGSTYTVSHNRRALEFIISDVAPAARQRFGESVVFHVTGAKFPKECEPRLSSTVRYDGFIPDMNSYLSGMDAALVPSLFGAGMQQKIFEPLARGFPTVTHERGLAGYPFRSGVEVLTADTREEYLSALERLVHYDERVRLSAAAAALSRQLFQASVLDQTVNNALKSITNDDLI